MLNYFIAALLKFIFFLLLISDYKSYDCNNMKITCAIFQDYGTTFYQFSVVLFHLTFPSSTFCLKCLSWSSYVSQYCILYSLIMWSIKCAHLGLSLFSVFCDGMDCFIILMFRMLILVFVGILLFSIFYSLILGRNGLIHHPFVKNVNLGLFHYS